MIVERRAVKLGTYNPHSFLRFCTCGDCHSSAVWKVQVFPGHFDFLCSAHVKTWERAYGDALNNWAEPDPDTSATGRPALDGRCPAAPMPTHMGPPSSAEPAILGAAA